MCACVCSGRLALPLGEAQTNMGCSRKVQAIMAELKRITTSDKTDFDKSYVNTAFYELHPRSGDEEGPPSKQPDRGMVASPSGGGFAEPSKVKIIKNLLVVSFGFLLLFTAFQSLSNLQSTLNQEEGLGTASLSVIYGALVVSCMFLPTFLISWLGLKYTLILSILMYSTYFVANFYAKWGTLIPASIILGLGGAPLWTSKCAYLTDIAGKYASLVSIPVENAVVRFFGVFFMIFQSGQIWGNLITYYVLKPAVGNATDVDLSLCGAAFHPQDKNSSANNTNLERPNFVKVYTLCGIYTGCALLAALFIFLFLDPLPRPRDSASGRKSFKLLMETMRHLRNVHQDLLIPLTVFSGLEQAFIVGDFTKAYVGCAWGIHNIGYVMICFGLFDALGSMSLGPLMKVIGRVPIFVFGAAVNVAMIITMLLWKPSPDEVSVFFVISGLWGLGDAVWQTQINSIYGVLFPKKEEAAFANYRLWESLGFIIAFSYSNFLQTDVKLYILLAVLGIGMLCYLAIEVHISFTSHRSQSNTEKK